MPYSAKRGITIACRPSVRPSVCLSVCNVGGSGAHRLDFGKSSRGRTQGLWKIFTAPIYRAHRAVIFAIAQLSCFNICACHQSVEFVTGQKAAILCG